MTVANSAMNADCPPSREERRLKIESDRSVPTSLEERRKKFQSAPGRMFSDAAGYCSNSGSPTAREEQMSFRGELRSVPVPLRNLFQNPNADFKQGELANKLSARGGPKVSKLRLRRASTSLPRLEKLEKLQVETCKVHDMAKLEPQGPKRVLRTSSWDAIEEAVRDVKNNQRRRSDSCVHADHMRRASAEARPLSATRLSSRMNWSYIGQRCVIDSDSSDN